MSLVRSVLCRVVRRVFCRVTDPRPPIGTPPEGGGEDALLMETGDNLLLESGDQLLME